MHRSGTSALSGILQLLGFDLGADLIGPNEFNPSGYWENQQVVRLNEDYIGDWRGSLRNAFAQLGLKPLRSFDQATHDIEKFIAKGRTRDEGAVCRPSPEIGCNLVKEAFETLRDAGRFAARPVEDRCDGLMNRFRDSAGLLLRALAENDLRAELEAARKQISVLSAKELALKGKVAELQKRKMLLTERDSFRVRDFLSTGVWRFWWLWLPISLIPVWIFD